jgi:hypothetical protein
MGLLYTTEATRRILDTLNTAFDESGLSYIRARIDPTAPVTDPRRQLYDMLDQRQWRRGHLATALELFPYDQGPGSGLVPDHKRRWAFLLRSVVASKFDDLKRALSDAILNRTGVNIVKMSFSHVEKSGAPNLVVFDAPMIPGNPGGDYVRHITLFTRRLMGGENDDFEPPAQGEPPPFANPPWKRP